MASYLRRVREIVLAGQPVSMYGLHREHESSVGHQYRPHRERGGANMKLFKLPFMFVGFLFITAVTMFVMLVDWILQTLFGEDY